MPPSTNPDPPPCPVDDAYGPPAFPFPGGAEGNFSRLVWLREHEPVSRVTVHSGHTVWLVTRYEDVRLVLSDRRFSVAAVKEPGAPRLGPFDFSSGVTQLRDTDPPRHSQLRRLVGPAFSVPQIARLRPLIQRVTDGLLDRLATAGPPADLVEGLARPLPTAVVCAWLGVPAEDAPRIRSLQDSMNGKGPLEHVLRTEVQILDYVSGLVAARRASPGDDFLTGLIRARDEQDALTDGELTGLVLSMVIAGHPVLSNVLAASLDTLLRTPGALGRLRERPASVPRAVEELLRYHLVLRDGQLRVATEDIELGERTIRAGEAVVTSVNSANRDPAVFPDPDGLDLERTPNPQLAFGHGIHRCLAAHLCRAELGIAIGSLLARFPGLRPADPDWDRTWKPELRLRGLVSLPASW